MSEQAASAIKADPQLERRRRVIEELETYKLRLDAKVTLRERYEAICTQLYSGRSSRITGMPTNHDQFAAQDHFAEMLDEKLALERALAGEDEDEEIVRTALTLLDERAQLAIKEFYLSGAPRSAVMRLQTLYGLSTGHIYRIRDYALDTLADVLLWEN